MKPVQRLTGQDAAYKAKVDTLLGERHPNSPDRAIRWGELGEALQARGVTNVLSQIVNTNVARKAKGVENQVGSITTTQRLVASFEFADGLVGEGTLETAPVILGNASLSGWDAATLTVLYLGTADNLHRTDSMGTVELLLNNTPVQRGSVGTLAAGAAARFVMPIALGGLFLGPETTLAMQVRGWTFHPDTPATGFGGFYVRRSKLLVFGGIA